ncbi:MAG: thioredoxin domain-containing protein, partial [Candidatus ainarchaeum sp.]|nr:thioredoxin domain-containing protein [Candidatus ainarchaeum sp.]
GESAQRALEKAAAGRPFKGAADAKVTIVSFTDFRCPPCAEGAEIIDRLMKERPGQIKYVLMNFPLGYANSQAAAEAFEVAAAQDPAKAFRLKEIMHENREYLSPGDLRDYAREADLDAKNFHEALKRGDGTKAVAEQAELGRELGLRSAPVFFINGKEIRGAQDYEVFERAVDQALAAAQEADSMSAARERARKLLGGGGLPSHELRKLAFRTGKPIDKSRPGKRPAMPASRH